MEILNSTHASKKGKSIFLYIRLYIAKPVLFSLIALENSLLIKARGDMSQDRFAEATGISRSTIALYEACKSNTRPTLNTIYKISNASKISINELMLAAGYSENEMLIEDHPLIDALRDVLRGHEYLLLNSDDIRLIKATVNTLITELKNK